jgi:hypothetical protein
MRKTLFALSASVLTWLLSVALVMAQSNCSDLVTQALEAVDESCSSTGRNEACYGYDQVEASFLVDVADDFFSQVASISPVADIETIRTAPLNTETGVWGVAVMNIQADLPNTLPGQSVTFILLGDVEVENAVAPEDAFVPSEGLDVTVNIAAGANVRSGPGTNYNVIGGLQNGQTVLADGVSEDGEWLRVAYRERPAWLSISVIDSGAAGISELPTLSAELQTPMQAFYLRTGIGEPECGEAPDDILVVQGPENININITVNGANVQLGSSGAFRIIMIDGQPFLEIIVFDGHFLVDGQNITQGQHSVICLGDENSRGLDGENNDLVVTCDASEPEPIEDFGEEWCIMEDVPSDILNYGLEVLCPGETPPPLPTEQVGQGGASNSELEAVDCSSFAILTGSIPATNFILSWSPATGADSYEVAVYDSGGNQTSVYSGLTATSIGLNGGGGFASSGYVDVRAYQAGQYACYVRLNFTRTPDPNEPIGGYGGPGFSVTLSYCDWPDGMSFTVSWQNAEEEVVVTIPGTSYVYSSSSESGSLGDEYMGFVPSSGTIVVSSGDHTVTFGCPDPYGA